MTDPSPPPASPFQIPSGLDVYDALMGEIDLDLVSTSIPHLEGKYRDEKPEERMERHKRYEAAFGKFNDTFEDWNVNLQLAVSALKHQALQSAETKSRKEEEGILTDLEAKLSS